MAKTRPQKETAVAELADKLGRAQAVVVTNYQGLTVRETEELRGTLREQGMDYDVVKNTLYQLAAKQAGLTVDDLTGPAAIAFGYDDPVLATKVVSRFAKDNEKLDIVSGVIDGKQVDITVIKKLAALPSREELLGRLIGSISSPAQKLVTALSATTRDLAFALRAVQEQKS